MAENIKTHGDSIKTEGDSLVIYPDKHKMIRRLNMCGLCILLPVASGIFVLFAFLRRLLVSVTQHAAFPLPPLTGTVLTLMTYGRWCVVVLYFALYVIMRAFLQRQNRPLLTLSPEGLTLGGSGTQIGLLYWDEIGEVRSYTFIYRFVGIVPRHCRSLPAIGSPLASSSPHGMVHSSLPAVRDIRRADQLFAG